ncbi:MAG: TolC family protein [Candidatus Rokuibacteriota bacterium]
MHSRSRRHLVGVLVAVVLGLPAPLVAQSPPAAPPSRITPAPGQVLSLPEAIDLALRQHPSLRSGEEARKAAEARVPQAQSAYYPQFDVSVSAGRSQIFSSSTKRTSQSNAIAPTFEGSQLVYDFGKTSALVDEARAGVRVSDAELERLREVVVFNVRQSYYNLLQARRLVRVAEAALARAELNLRSARGFFEVGTKPKSDVTKAEVEVANARVSVIRARNDVRLAETALANALGLEARTPVEVQDILAYDPVSLDPVVLLAEALLNRPELVQAQARLDAARAQLAGARAGYTPDLSLKGTAGTTSFDEPPLRETWSIALALSWNLFQGFFTTHKVRETVALVEVARANYDTLELQVRLEVEQAYIALVEAAERIAATEKAVESAQENLRLAQGRYDAGVGTILDLTEAQLALTNAEADQVRALTDHKLGLAALDRAVGRP